MAFLFLPASIIDLSLNFGIKAWRYIRGALSAGRLCMLKYRKAETLVFQNKGVL